MKLNIAVLPGDGDRTRDFRARRGSNECRL